jgi:hypothetical protein
MIGLMDRALDGRLYVRWWSRTESTIRRVACMNLDFWYLILCSQLIDNPPTPSLRPSPLWNMFSLACQCCVVALITRKFAITTDTYDRSVLKLKLSCPDPPIQAVVIVLR